MSNINPYARTGVDVRRGVAFILVLTAALTALQVAASLGSLTGLAYGALFVLVIVAITYAFTRFW
jgi:hypothetical protein